MMMVVVMMVMAAWDELANYAWNCMMVMVMMVVGELRSAACRSLDDTRVVGLEQC
jgi:hypothetical protein